MFFEGIAEIVVRSGVIRVDRQRSPILEHRLLQFALLSQSYADIVVGVGVPWLDGQRSPILRDRFIQFILRFECVAEIEARFREIRLDG